MDLATARVKFVSMNPLSPIQKKEGCLKMLQRDSKLLEFYNAILEDDEVNMEKIIAEGIDVNCPNPHTGKYALLEAVSHQKDRMIEILINAGVDVNVRNAQGETALHLAVEYHKFNAKAIRHLLNKGCDPNITDKLSGNIPLHILARFYGANWRDDRFEVKEIMTLLTSLSQVNARNFRGFTPLHFATVATDYVTEPVKILLEGGADPNIENYRCETPLHEALDKGFSNVARELIEHGADVTVRNRYDQTPLHYAARRNCLEGIRVLLSRPECDVNIRDLRGDTILHISAGKGFTEIVKDLVKHPKIDINAQNNFNITPLHVAVESGFSEIVQVLLQSNSDIFMQTELEQTALDLAQDMFVKKSHPEIEAMILQVYQEKSRSDQSEDICTEI